MSEFRYPVAAGVKGCLRFGDDRLTFKQGLRTTVIALPAVRAFAVRVRGKSLGVVASELLIQVDRGGGAPKLHKLPFDSEHEQAQQALARLAQLVPAEADLRALSWEDAAARLGVKAHGVADRLMNPKAVLGVVVIGASVAAGAMTRTLWPAASPAESAGQGVGVLIGVVVGAVLLVKGLRASRA